jgi:hypothetical protein
VVGEKRDLRHYFFNIKLDIQMVIINVIWTP